MIPKLTPGQEAFFDGIETIAEEDARRKRERTIWYVVGDLTQPTGEPFVLMKVDTSIRREGGVEGEVISLHWQREEAERLAKEFNEGPLN